MCHPAGVAAKFIAKLHRLSSGKRLTAEKPLFLRHHAYVKDRNDRLMIRVFSVTNQNVLTLALIVQQANLSTQGLWL